MTEDKSSSMHPILGIPWEKMPRHVAIIMDGNGRWAQKQGLQRLEGHAAGSKSVRGTITESARIGLECLTLYSFSTENWNRPASEVDGLMKLYQQYLIEERPTIMNNNIRLRHLGHKDRLPEFVLDELRETARLSKDNDGMTLCLALDYSGRSEIKTAFQMLASEVANGKYTPGDIDEELIGSYLDTAGLPDPDLLVRTSGEMRISNFLLWQISYAELYVTDVHWPDFTHDVLYEAIRNYSSRDRRFGGLDPSQR